MTFILFLLLLTLALSLSLYVHLNHHQSSLHICQTEFLKAQKSVAQDLEELFLLNPQAQNLRLQEKRAEIELAMAVAAGNPALIAKATANLQKIRGAQRVLDLRQRALLMSAQNHMDRALISVPLKIKDFFHEEKKRWSEEFQIQAAVFKPRRTILAVQPDRVGVIAPVYETVEPFGERQALQASWMSDRATRSPWESFLFKKYRDRMEQKCQVTIRQKKNRFEAALVWDKFF